MISIWKTRLMLWKKQALILFFWLIFPITGTIIILSLTETVQKDSKIPVGIVMEEDTELANHLYEAISKSPLIRIVDVTNLEARQKVQTNNLDSVFIMKEGFEENIKNGNRNWVIGSYYTNMSFGYIPVKEMVVSNVQDASGKFKAAHTIQELSNDSDLSWIAEEIILRATTIQSEEDLLRSEFSFQQDSSKREENHYIWNAWGIWSTLSLLSTFFLFDWVIKERRTSLIPRFTFSRFSMRVYLVSNLLIYTFFLSLVDLITAYIFYYFLDEGINSLLLFHLLLYRMISVTGAFLVALIFTNTYIYFCIALFTSIMLTILSGMDSLQSFERISTWHPMTSFIEQDGISLLHYIVLGIFIVWWRKEGKFQHA